MKDKIVKKNDEFRRTLLGGRVVATPRVMNSPHKEKIVQMVKDFDYFSTANDPHAEHNQGAVVFMDNTYLEADY